MPPVREEEVDAAVGREGGEHRWWERRRMPPLPPMGEKEEDAAVGRGHRR